MAFQPGTNRQAPDHAILDRFDKQVYLGNRWGYLYAHTVSGTSEAPSLVLSNPAVSGSGFPASYTSLFVNQISFTGETASANTIVKVYLGPTTSAGTAATVVNMRPASSSTAVASLKYLPTASVNGTLVDVLSGTAYQTVSRSDLIILDPGKSLLITVQSADTAAVGIKLGWYEI